MVELRKDKFLTSIKFNRRDFFYSLLKVLNVLNFNKIKSFLGKYKILKFSRLINAKEIHFKTKKFF